MPPPRHVALHRCCTLWAALWLAGPVPAQDDSALAEAARPAVVRLVYPQGGAMSGCSGVRLADGAVLTAGHCLGPSGTGRPAVLPADPGGGVATVAARLDPDATGAPGAHDLARLDLAEPRPGLPLGPPPRPGETLLLIGFPNDGGGARTEQACPVIAVEDGLALVGCRVRNGFSGAPLLRDGPHGAEIVAITVARAGQEALAAIPGAWARGD